MSTREKFNTIWHAAVVISIYFGLIYLPAGMV